MWENNLNLLAPSINSLWRLTNAFCLSWVILGSSHVVIFCSSQVFIGEVLPVEPTIGRVHRSAIGSFMPVNIILPFHLTTHFSMSNLTMHPASVSTRIPKREAIDNSGTMCPTSVVGRPGIIISHMCVDITLHPSANATLSKHLAFRLLWTGVPSIIKNWVASKSAIALFDAIVIAV